MKRNAFVLLLLMLALLFSACGKEAVPDFTAATDPDTESVTPSSTTAPTVPLNPNNAATNVKLIPSSTVAEADFQTFLNKEYWYRRVLNCTFAKPQDIPAEMYFRSSLLVYDKQDNTLFTNEERAFLHTQWCEKYGATPWVNAYRIPVKSINEGLAILGITVKDIKTPENWVYYDKSDSFYAYINPANIYSVADVTVTKVDRTGDGLVRVYWQTEEVQIDTATGVVKEAGVPMVMTLRMHNDSYVIVSNVPGAYDPMTFAKLNTPEDYTAFIQQQWWCLRALGCTFEKPEEISLQHYFYIGMPKGNYHSSTFTAEEQAAINAAYIKKYGVDPYTGATKLPVQEIQNALSVLGVALSDVKIPDNWIYYDKTDSYYFWKSDAYGVVGWSVTDVAKDDEGIVKVYWETSAMHHNTATGEFWPKGVKMVMTMQAKPDGGYLILSNLPVE